MFLSLSVIILYHGTRGKSRVFSNFFEKIFLPSIAKKANPNRFLPHFLPHFCRTSTLCRTPAAVFLHPNAPKIPFEKRYKKCRFIAIYRDKSAFSEIVLSNTPSNGKMNRKHCVFSKISRNTGKNLIPILPLPHFCRTFRNCHFMGFPVIPQCLLCGNFHFIRKVGINICCHFNVRMSH